MRCTSGNHANLLSAVDEAHLPRAEARTILEGVEFRDQVFLRHVRCITHFCFTSIFRILLQVLQQYSEIQAAGVYAIPVFIFEIGKEIHLHQFVLDNVDEKGRSFTEGRREVVSGAASVSEYASVLRNLLEAQ